MSKLSIKAPGNKMMVSNLRIGYGKSCGLKGWPRDARLSSRCKGGSKQARGKEMQKCAFFSVEEMAGHSCKLGGFGEFKWWPKGGPWLVYACPISLVQEVVCVCVCVCVCEELQLK